jgi:hypothetical protein
MAHELVDPEQAVEYGLFTRDQALRAGVPAKEIARRLRVGRWQTFGYGLYEEVGRDPRSEDRIVRAVLAAGPSAVASHLTSAYALGWDLLKSQSVQLTVPRTHGSVKVREATVFRRDFTSDEITVSGVLPTTSAERTAVDVAADSPTVDAVVAIDAGLRCGHLTLETLQAARRARSAMPWHPRVKRVLDLVDRLSGSVPESVARVLFQEAGVPPPQTQFEVRDVDGCFLARVDFAWPEIRLVVEIDGFEWHSKYAAFTSDRNRQNELELAGWMVLRFTAEQVREAPEQVATVVRRAFGF